MPPKRIITVETKLSGAGGKKGHGLPSLASVVPAGQSCLKCGDKCAGGYSPHLCSYRKTCVTCGCARDCHQTCDISGLTLEDNGLPDSDRKKLNMKYAWYPSGISINLVERYMACLPNNCIPLKGSKAEKKRKEKFMDQQPQHDANVEFCHDNMPEIDKKRLKRFEEKRLRNCFGVGKVSVMTINADKLCKCHGCSNPIDQESIVVTAEEKMGRDNFWHPQCFRCSTCMELLVDLHYFHSSGKKEIYCGRHHGETIVPRCNGCDELIFSGTFTEAKGKSWHKYHFSCASCGQELHGKLLKEENEKLFCEKCYNSELAIKCVKCQTSIGLGSKKVTIESKYSWHAECFACMRCRESLVGRQYYYISDRLLCLECQSDQITTQCHGCKNAVDSTVSFLKHKTRYWHTECFKCVICQAWLANGKFNEMDDNIMCTNCFTIKTSKKCAMCQETITTKGVQFGLASYHDGCFNCSSCTKSLIGESKVKDRDGHPVCIECNMKFAKKCFRCNGPITSRHTLYKGRMFHIECFKCNLCGSNIDRTEFFETSLNEILCAKCAL